VFYAIIVSPLLLGVLVRNFGWLIILSPQGPLNQILLGLGLTQQPVRLLYTQGAVVLALIHVFLPFMVLPITGALRATPGTLAEASEALGAGWLRTFWHVTLPLSFPGLQAGVILVFVLSVSAYVTPALIGGQGSAYLSLLMVQELTGAFAWPFGAALALVLAAAMLLCVLAFTLATHRLAARTAR
jgi:putative spermidine/putrescine transport system permease protein